jgi:hypothetical protein
MQAATLRSLKVLANLVLRLKDANHGQEMGKRRESEKE